MSDLNISSEILSEISPMKSVTSPDISSRPYLDRLTRLRLRVRLLPRLHLDIACLALPLTASSLPSPLSLCWERLTTCPPCVVWHGSPRRRLPHAQTLLREQLQVFNCFSCPYLFMVLRRRLPACVPQTVAVSEWKFAGKA